METLGEILKAFPLAYRKDYGGFILVAFQEPGGVWSGRAWRSSDWKAFGVVVSGSSADDIFSQYKAKIAVLRDVLSSGCPL